MGPPTNSGTTSDVFLDRASVVFSVPPSHGFAWTGGGAQEWDKSFYVDMLIGDFCLGIMPFQASDDDGGYKLELKDGDHHAEELVAKGLSPHQHGTSLTTAVADWLRGSAEVVLRSGLDAYELGYWIHNVERKPVGFRLIRLETEYLIWKRKRVFQRVPQGSLLDRLSPFEGRKAQDSDELREIEADRIALFKAPSVLQKRSWKALRDLAYIGGKHSAQNLMPDLSDSGGRDVPFDFSEFHKSQNEALAAATRALGWNGRGLWDRALSSYHSVYRYLRFRRAQMDLRNCLLASLQETIQRAGRRIGFDGTLNLSGLTTTEDLDKAEHHLRAGDTPLTSIIGQF